MCLIVRKRHMAFTAVYGGEGMGRIGRQPWKLFKLYDLKWITICYWIGVHVFVFTTTHNPGGMPATLAGSCTSTQNSATPLCIPLGFSHLARQPSRPTSNKHSCLSLEGWEAPAALAGLQIANMTPFALVAPPHGHVCSAGHSLNEAVPRIIVSIRM